MTSDNLEFMNTPSSYWIDSTPWTDYPKLENDIEVDVAIVGGGLVGITSAFLLKQEGFKVAVVEADKILQGTTGHSTAKITSQHSLIYARLKKEMGEELSQQYAEANEKAIHMIASIAKENKIDCDFTWRPAYVYTQSEQYLQDIEDEARAASSLGIKASYLDDSPLPFPVKAALCFQDQAQFHPLKYLKALAAKISGQGSHIFEETAALDIQKDPSAVITRNGKKIKAAKIIIASHFPFFDGGGMYFAKMYVEKSYIIGIKINEKFPEGMFITAESPGRSLRSQNDGNEELVLIAGEHHKTGDGQNLNIHYQNLLDFAHQTFQVNEVKYRWSTQDCMTIDGVPYCGNITPKNPDLYVATGFGKWGISNGTATAMVMRDLISKGDSPWAPVYNPSRFNLKSTKTFLVQNLDVAKEYISGKFAAIPNDVEMPKGEARVVDVDGLRFGGYRDDQGDLHLVDITCTHLGCELKWNNAELSWDCPCHGSRFSVDGEIIEGPAFNYLQNPGQCQNQVEVRAFE
ncbi:MAG: FAD-dependent oxidoreductase [Syntrophomonas sp.]